MNRLPAPIPKTPALKPAEDYYRLRREGISFIEQMGSRWWTDYNTHDPGITILEALCYAITDLAYRIGWDIKDLLAPDKPTVDKARPFPQQAFFTARTILTVNPTTPDDFRRLLIDLDGVRNAWVFCKTCACEAAYFAWCESDEQLRLAYQPPQTPTLEIEPKKIEPQGLYEVLLELEADPELGDLNDRKIVQTFTLESAGELQPYTLELRFPAWELVERATYEAFLNSTTGLTTITCEKPLPGKLDLTSITEADFQRLWREVFYCSLQFSVGSKTIVIHNVALRLVTAPDTARRLTVKDVLEKLQETGARGFLPQYRRKLQTIATQVKAAQATLHRHRNLDEDYCRIKVAEVEDVAVCADIEVQPDADIERVQARIWLAIEQYFNPPIRFYTWQELLDAQVPVEEIFNGPELNNGFLKAEELAAAGLKTVLRVSDIINLLMDIEGVIAVNHLLLGKYDAEGNIVNAAADWLLPISELHQPRFYQNLSRFLFYKNGLPFLPRLDEAQDTLTQLRGEADRPKNPHAPNDLPVPTGIYRYPEAYTPVQDSFPLTYGIGRDGLPPNASPARRAQAKQLKAYLLVFEQLLANALAQVAHTADLFSLDATVADRTYFVHEFKAGAIRGYEEILYDSGPKKLDEAKLKAMAETPAEFLERRNRFLNHLLARFGEQFSEYALLLTNYLGQQVALDRLIKDKISFLNAYPQISHDRGKAFDYRTRPCAPDNVAGLKKRIRLLLGEPALSFVWKVTWAGGATNQQVSLQLQSANADAWLAADSSLATPTALTAFVDALVKPHDPLSYEITYSAGHLTLTLKDKTGKTHTQKLLEAVVPNPQAQSLVSEITTTCRRLLRRMTLAETYQAAVEGTQFRLHLTEAGKPLGTCPKKFQTKADADAFAKALQTWSANERAIVVEHLLLRPKFPGDALFPACAEKPCASCGDFDPYSFRLTFVMPGWTEPYNINMDLRGFADRTIRQEMPAHLLGKICWVSNDGFIENPCEQVVGEVAKLLVEKGLTATGIPPTDIEACTCAVSIYTAFSKVFKAWYDGKMLGYFHPDALLTVLATEFKTKVTAAAVSCTTDVAPLWADIQERMVQHFQQLALNGWQFERFEEAWCKWLTVNAKMDWAEERLAERVETILKTTFPNESKAKLCQCTSSIVGRFGMAFYRWMESNLAAHKPFAAFGTFVLPSADEATLFQDCKLPLTTQTATAIKDLLTERYNSYQEASYSLWIVVHLLSNLHNTYPGATLHDCDDGSDLNPVRLDQTALGNYPLRQVAPSLAPELNTAPELNAAPVLPSPQRPKRATSVKPGNPNKPGKARKPKPRLSGSALGE